MVRRRSMLVRTALLLALALGLAACANRPRVGEVDPAFSAPYALGPGDRLRVVVFGQDGLTNSYTVDSSGKISMPLIGSVEARGLTTSALGQAIVVKLKNGYIREPHVAVEVETYRPFFILGEVNNAGQFAYVNGLTIESAIAVAGGFSPRATKTNAVVARTVDGKLVHARVPLWYPVRPGDTITVEERWL
jgi:polysaccharide export outer membrane protein